MDADAARCLSATSGKNQKKKSEASSNLRRAYFCFSSKTSVLHVGHDLFSRSQGSTHSPWYT